MPLRLIYIKFPKENHSKLNEIIKDKSIFISTKNFENTTETKLLMSAELAEIFLDEFNKTFEIDEHFSIIITNAEASIPYYEEKPPNEVFNTAKSNIKKNKNALP